jgi:hypothetical protein
MADISFDVAEGYYLSPFTAKMILSGNVQSLQFSVNGAPPSISKYVAYDQLTPPNPFIAVTQDGTGNVVYDGGFPKFYNNVAPTAGINASISMEFSAKCVGVAAGTNAYYYNAFNDLNVTLAIGDKLVYDMWQNSVDCQTGIDGVTADSADLATYSLRDWGRTTPGVGGGQIKDQNGLSSHPGTNLGTRAVNQWYHREFDLTPAAGHKFIRWSMAMEGETPGDFYARYRDVYILDKNGAIKATLFKDTLKLPGNSSTEAGASGYTNLAKSIYDPRGQLSASFKYLYNAIIWTANQKKLAAGNRKVLVLGDGTVNYRIKGTGPNDFNTSLVRLFAAVGFTPTFKDVTDYTGGKLDESAASLDQYVCVLFMSTANGTTGYFTDACVQALVNYREAGNGLIIVTDHGPVITDIANAYPFTEGNAFFASANQLIKNFGAYFSGNYDRTPVNVGFLRSTYGDHPLYAGMTNDESIAAGPSESRVQVAVYPTVLPGDVQPFNIGNGKTVIQVTAVLKSGEIIPFKITYNVVNFKLSISDGTQSADNGQKLNVGVKNQSLINVVLTGNPGVNASGTVLKNGVKVGSIAITAAGVLSQLWDSGGQGAVAVQGGDTFSAVITTPVSLTTVITITRFQPSIKGKRSLAEVMKTLRAYKPTQTPIKNVIAIIGEIASVVPWLGLKPSLNMPTNLKLIGDYFLNQGLAALVLPNAGSKPYDANARPWAASGAYALWKPANPVNGTPVDFGYLMFSPVYGTELVPGNFKLDYYANLYIPAGTYRLFAQADDIFDFYLDGLQYTQIGAQGEATIVIPESRYYAAKVSNTNIPADTPSYWTFAMVNMTTGEVVIRPAPGVWKTQEYSAS